MKTLLEVVAVYSPVSLVNARFFRALQESATETRAGEKAKLEQLQALRQELRSLILPATQPNDLLLTGKIGALTNEQQQALKSTHLTLQRTMELVSMARPSLHENLNNG